MHNLIIFLVICLLLFLIYYIHSDYVLVENFESAQENKTTLQITVMVDGVGYPFIKKGESEPEKIFVNLKEGIVSNFTLEEFDLDKDVLFFQVTNKKGFGGIILKYKMPGSNKSIFTTGQNWLIQNDKGIQLQEYEWGQERLEERKAFNAGPDISDDTCKWVWVPQSEVNCSLEFPRRLEPQDEACFDQGTYIFVFNTGTAARAFANKKTTYYCPFKNPKNPCTNEKVASKCPAGYTETSPGVCETNWSTQCGMSCAEEKCRGSRGQWEETGTDTYKCNLKVKPQDPMICIRKFAKFNNKLDRGQYLSKSEKDYIKSSYLIVEKWFDQTFKKKSIFEINQWSKPQIDKTVSLESFLKKVMAQFHTKFIDVNTPEMIQKMKLYYSDHYPFSYARVKHSPRFDNKELERSIKIYGVTSLGPSTGAMIYKEVSKDGKESDKMKGQTFEFGEVNGQTKVISMNPTPMSTDIIYFDREYNEVDLRNFNQSAALDTKWEWVAEKNSSFVVPKGGLVRYGTEREWKYQELDNENRYGECTDAFFGKEESPVDANYQCEMLRDGQTVNVDKWIHAANEGGDFDVKNGTKMRYGNALGWKESIAKGPGKKKCEAKTFDGVQYKPLTRNGQNMAPIFQKRYCQIYKDKNIVNLS